MTRKNSLAYTVAQLIGQVHQHALGSYVEWPKEKNILAVIRCAHKITPVLLVKSSEELREYGGNTIAQYRSNDAVFFAPEALMTSKTIWARYYYCINEQFLNAVESQKHLRRCRTRFNALEAEILSKLTPIIRQHLRFASLIPKDHCYSANDFGDMIALRWFEKKSEQKAQYGNNFDELDEEDVTYRETFDEYEDEVPTPAKRKVIFTFPGEPEDSFVVDQLTTNLLARRKNKDIVFKELKNILLG